MEQIGLIAGNGALPMVVAVAARKQGVKVKAIGIREETDPDIEKNVDSISWLSVGQLGKMLEVFKQAGVNKALMIGQIRHRLIFSDIQVDAEFMQLLGGLKDRKTDTILGAIAARLKREGIDLIDSSTYIKDLLPPVGVLSRRVPSESEQEDIRFGLGLAKGIAGLDIGQTVVVKDKAVLGVEAIEGTDEAVRRAGTFAQGIVVVKVSKPNQDLRFDIPIVGKRTVDVLAETHAAVLAIEAGKTLLLDQEYLLQTANKNQISIVAV